MFSFDRVVTPDLHVHADERGVELVVDGKKILLTNIRALLEAVEDGRTFHQVLFEDAVATHRANLVLRSLDEAESWQREADADYVCQDPAHRTCGCSKGA